MKKITTLLLLLIAALVVVMPTFADEEGLIDLYPYDSAANLTETEPIPAGSTRVGTSHWTMEFLGYRYHFVRNAVRYGHQFVDANSDGVYDDTEYPGVSYSGFAAMTINNTEDELRLSSTNLRANITAGVTNRIYSYFDEDGELVMFEDQLFQYYIHNDGTDVTDNADWRFATEAEITAFDEAADPLVDTPNTRFARIRVIKDSDDSDGYVLEPIQFTYWGNPDLGVSPADPADSLLVDWDPNYVVIPAGWSVVSFGQWDRDTYTALDFVELLHTVFLMEEAPKMTVAYGHPNPVFAGISANDDDGATPGTQMIVEFNEVGFNLPNNVSASWVKMFDEEGAIINETEKLDYKVEIFDAADFNSAEEDHVPTVLETINFVFDADTDAYTPSAALTKVDSSIFGAGYMALYSAVHPEDGLTKVEVDIAVGVLPPRFENVKNRYADENVFVDLLGEVTANDGYGNDKTGDIKVTVPSGFNYYNPQAGEYTINLEFVHHVHIPGDEYSLSIKGTEVDWDPVNALDKELSAGVGQGINTYVLYQVFTKNELVRSASSGWGSMIVIVGADGTVKESYSRYDWLHVSEDNPNGIVKDGDQFDAWKAAIDLQEGEFALTGHGSTNNVGPTLRALRYGDSVELVLGTPDFDVDIVTKASYKLTIDDKTAPQAIVVDKNYTIDADKYTNANNAILANIVAVDNVDSRDQLSLFVLSNGGLTVENGQLKPGTYQVEVGVEDRAGNSTEVSFTVIVKAAKPTQDEVDQKVDEVDQKVDEKADEVESKIPGNTITPEEVEAAIQDALDAQEKGVNVLTAVLMSLGAALLSFGGAALLFFLKKK